MTATKKRKLRQTSFDMMTLPHEKMDGGSETKRIELEARERGREARERKQLDILKQNQVVKSQLLQVITQQQQQFMVYLLSKK